MTAHPQGARCRFGVRSAIAALAFFGLAQGAEAQESRILDTLDTIEAWQAAASDSVSAQKAQAQGVEGGALRLDFDFHQVAGYAYATRTLPIGFPENYEISFWLRADAPVNNFEVKLVDASGANVWWRNQRDFAFPDTWTRVRLKKRHLEFAWGPTADRTLRRSERIEFVVTRGRDGGTGSIYIDQIEFRELPPEGAALPSPIAHADAAHGSPAAFAVDGNLATAWRARAGRQRTLTIDFGAQREFGGLEPVWAEGAHAADYDVLLSEDGRNWTLARRIMGGDGGRDPLLMTESEARYVRFDLRKGAGRAYALAEVEVKPTAWGASATAFVESLAQSAPRGAFPRGFVEQSYWTLIGADGAADNALMSEDGAFELGKGGFSIEPFVRAGGRILSWADVSVTHALADGYLPIPTATWTAPGLSLKITGFAEGDRTRSALVARYDIANTGATPHSFDLILAARPFQVNGPRQFLNVQGGASRVEQLGFDENGLSVNGRLRAAPLTPPTRVVANRFDAGLLPYSGFEGSAPAASDETGFASGAWIYSFTLPPGETRTVAWSAPLTGEISFLNPACPSVIPSAAKRRPGTEGQRTRHAAAGSRLSGALRAPPAGMTEGDVELEQRNVPVDHGAGGDAAPSRERCDLDQRQQRVAEAWRTALDRVDIQVPQEGRRIVDTLKSSLAHILMSREGPILKPGARSYDRSWIRDGAMIAEGLIRLAVPDAAGDYLRWFAPYQFESGKIPCCVDKRGADPTPENDSHGEFIFLAAEVWRATRDEALFREIWPHVDAAVRHMDALRASETQNNAAASRRHLYGLLPPSISHEGYSSAPAYSYWDDFWALLGYKEAVDLAQAIGDRAAAQRITASRDAFRRDLFASIAAMRRVHDIDYIPGAADLGDFDATSTTIALAPAGEGGNLPRAALEATFERYWREFVARRDGRRTWDAYTPYEIRNVGAFVRLGWRERAYELLDYFLKDRRPAAWNGWAEVVGREPRKHRFIGDMPHAWISSDYIRSALELFAYRRDSDEALVLAAGVPSRWLEDGIAVRGLRTPYGLVSYTLKRERNRLTLDVEGGAPPGGFVLPWPYAEPPGQAIFDGRRIHAHNGEHRLVRSGRLDVVVN